MRSVRALTKSAEAFQFFDVNDKFGGGSMAQGSVGGRPTDAPQLGLNANTIGIGALAMAMRGMPGGFGKAKMPRELPAVPKALPNQMPTSAMAGKGTPGLVNDKNVPNDFH